ncbi:hypothetical protein ACHWQZ_G000981 [Mnemiopsis leidyi]
MDSKRQQVYVQCCNLGRHRPLPISNRTQQPGAKKTLRPSDSLLVCNSLLIKNSMKSAFETQWKEDKSSNKKLKFYNSFKDDFVRESYLSFALNNQQVKGLAQIRTSSHRFNIVTGRYGKDRRLSITNRLCYHCCADNLEMLLNVKELPFFDPIIEDEVNVLSQCPLYEDLRENLSDSSRITNRPTSSSSSQ